MAEKGPPERSIPAQSKSISLRRAAAMVHAALIGKATPPASARLGALLKNQELSRVGDFLAIWKRLGSGA